MKAALTLLACAAWHTSAAGAALGLAGEQLFALPPEPVVRRVLQDLPSLRLGGLQQELAVAERSRLQAGPHEWVVRGDVARRRVPAENGRYREEEFGVERRVRWFGKAAQDRAVGEQGILLADAQRADAWHDSGRTLMSDWYNALRALASLKLLQDQHGLLKQLHAVAERRVQAGDGPALEALQADTELRRSDALLAQAAQDAHQAMALLSTSYAGLPLPATATLPEPQQETGKLDDLMGPLLEDDHELAVAQLEARLYGLKARRAASERMPDPTLGLRAGRERDGAERTIGLTLSIPLPGAARSAEGAAASVQARMADARASQVGTKVRLNAQRVVAEQRHSYQIWTSLRDVAGQSARQAGLMERAYQAGETSLTDALLGRRQALDATLAAQTAQINALAASARYHLDAHALWPFD